MAIFTLQAEEERREEPPCASLAAKREAAERKRQARLALEQAVLEAQMEAEKAEAARRALNGGATKVIHK